MKKRIILSFNSYRNNNLERLKAMFKGKSKQSGKKKIVFLLSATTLL